MQMHKPTIEQLLAAAARQKFTAAESGVIFALLSSPKPRSEGYPPDYEISSRSRLYDDWTTWEANTGNKTHQKLTWLSRPAVYKATASLEARGFITYGDRYSSHMKLKIEALVPAPVEDPKSTAVEKPARSRANVTPVAVAGNGRRSRVWKKTKPRKRMAGEPIRRRKKSTPVASRSRLHGRRKVRS